MRHVEAAIKDAVILAHPGVAFTDFWLEPQTSWSGKDMVEVWAIYDGDVADLPPPTNIRTRIQDILWGVGLDAAPSLRLVAKSDMEDKLESV